MQLPEEPLRVFYINSTIACVGFLFLLAQTILGVRKAKANATTSKTASLVKRRPSDIRGRPAAFVALLTGTASMCAAWAAAATYTLAFSEKRPLVVVGDQTAAGLTFCGEEPFAPAATYRGLLALGISGALQACVILYLFLGTEETVLIRLARVVFAYPASIALSCVTYAALVLEVPLNVFVVGTMLSMVLIVMTVFAAVASTVYTAQDELDRDVRHRQWPGPERKE